MTPEGQLATFIARYTPKIGALAKNALKKMRTRLPGAVELVYDNRSVKPIDANRRRRLMIKSVSVKQRPRRPN